MSIVTLPDFALSELLSNLSWPLGSAESLSVPLAAPPPDVVGVLLVVAGAAGVLDELLLLLSLLLPQPATARAATSTKARWTRFDFIAPPSGSGRDGPRCKLTHSPPEESGRSRGDLPGQHTRAALRRVHPPGTALDGEAVVLVRRGGGGQPHVGDARGVHAEGAGADTSAVVAQAPELVDGPRGQPVHAQVDARAGGEGGEGGRRRGLRRGGLRAQRGRVDVAVVRGDRWGRAVGAAGDGDHAEHRRGTEGRAGGGGREGPSAQPTEAHAGGGRTSRPPPPPGDVVGCLTGEAIEHRLLEGGRRALGDGVRRAGEVHHRG